MLPQDGQLLLLHLGVLGHLGEDGEGEVGSGAESGVELLWWICSVADGKLVMILLRFDAPPKLLAVLATKSCIFSKPLF